MRLRSVDFYALTRAWGTLEGESVFFFGGDAVIYFCFYCLTLSDYIIMIVIYSWQRPVTRVLF